jgi:hypothetical protein
MDSGAIAKILKGSGMAGLLKYAAQEGKGPDGGAPVIIDRWHIHGNTVREMTREFGRVRAVAGPGQHVLDVPFGWRTHDHAPPRETRAAYIADWARMMGYGDCPRVTFEHLDTENVNDHVCLLRVNGKGEVVSDSWDWVRSNRICGELDLKYGLQPENRHPGMEPVPDRVPGKMDRARDVFRSAVKKTRQEDGTWLDLQDALGQEGYEIVPISKNSGVIQGYGIRGPEEFWSPISKMNKAWTESRLKLGGQLADIRDQAEALAWIRSRPSLDEIEALEFSEPQHSEVTHEHELQPDPKPGQRPHPRAGGEAAPVPPGHH